MGTVVVSEQILSSLRPSKGFKNHQEGTAITCLDFDDTGEWMITSGEDESLQLYDCVLGKHKKTLYSKKYGVDLARFTHRSTNVIYSSTKDDDTLRYLSLHDNVYIRYFRGHKKRVISLDMSPLDDHFISSSLDNSVRLWDLRSSICHGLLNISSPCLTAFDPAGVIFAVASYSLSSILLYDLRNYDKEPFSTFTLNDDGFLSKISYPPRMPDWIKMEFSNDGKLILIGTRGECHYLLDAFSGELQSRLTGQIPVNGDPKSITSGDMCFTPDARYVIGASGDKNLVIWDVKQTSRSKSLTPIQILNSGNIGPAKVVTFNPRKMMLATANNTLTFWLSENY
ncbi:hypothetical protein PORY_000360 [Pneumocystis oryctolagi]|uniref:Uncharacterized protein n=1 Tax=Pneumocystis oryctolagi TaxID=42067 RepID=A0ACB7CHL0_9ASCO|nr:hypothetical protein PORY_000360 [Pneumocystis oryctolagi]